MMKRYFAAAVAATVVFLGARMVQGAETPVVQAGTGSVQFGGLLQTWLSNDTTASSDAKSNFRLRRAEIKFQGSVAPRTRWFVMVDPAKSLKSGTVSSSNDNKILQDVGVAFDLMPELEIMMGQVKTPSTLEGLNSSSELFLAERSYSARAFGDRREPGVVLTYKTGPVKATAMVSNGNGTNVDDSTSSKDLTLRVDVSPHDFLKVGAFTTAGDFNYGKKGRFGANLGLRVADALLDVEAVRANESNVMQTGWAATAGYSVTESLLPVVRYDGFNGGTFTASHVGVGLNWYLSGKHAKIQATYGALQNMVGNGGGYSPSNGKGGSLLVLCFQAAI